jgi:hypothetical protein
MGSAKASRMAPPAVVPTNSGNFPNPKSGDPRGRRFYIMRVERVECHGAAK